MAIRLNIEDGHPNLFCDSKFWGDPDMPEDMEYPMVDGRPLTFICQVSCYDIALMDPDGLLPHDGMLYFFADMDEILGYETIAENAAYFPEAKREHYLRNPDRPVTVGTLEITEGKKHQVKLMIKEVGSHIFYLKRLKIGPVELDPALAPGEFRPMTEEELRSLGYEPK